ncbi:fibronectin type III domain-containing protein [Sphingobacterium wenxiniae]|uniref:Fibronectin type III domain-containing protein n=1 Tax=Sphingobacterium wenxiniae TaxID=683125 RepID=A0A1I6PHQ3_9SPHI|nr:fibronectin type III domain-containing protein [Sphingobacterium wenxiniae]SFS39585.1 Fibronectin type III domain-containing protein [Sphingobacterium wenxiniae]
MATKFKALIGFARMKDDELVVAANTIVGAMTDNPHFPTPSPSLEDVQDLLDDFSTKLAAARRRGSPEETALKNESREPLQLALQKLAYYVNGIAQGHLSTLLSSGFQTNSAGTIVQVPLKVERVRLSDGRQSGHVRLDFESQRKVLMYEYQYRMESESEWSDRLVTSSSKANIIAPLEVAQRYEVRVRAVNTHGVGDWSDTARILVR